MEIDLKIIIPLIGVILGWTLSSLTSFYKTRGDNRKILGKSISQLYYMIDELYIVIFHLDKMKDKLSVEEYEIHRQKSIERYTLKNEDSLSKINDLIDNISSISPSIGIELKHLLEGYLFERKVKLSSTRKNKQTYFFLLSAIEVTQDLTLARLEKLLVKLSFKHSIILGFRVKRQLRQEKERIQKEGGDFAENFYRLFDKKEKSQIFQSKDE